MKDQVLESEEDENQPAKSQFEAVVKENEKKLRVHEARMV
jgi:hypothetical protein